METNIRTATAIPLSRLAFADLDGLAPFGTYYLPNADDSLRNVRDAYGLERWKEEVLARCPDATVTIDPGADWHSRVRVDRLEPVRTAHTAAKARALASWGTAE